MEASLEVKQQVELGSKQWGVYVDGKLVEGGFFSCEAALCAAVCTDDNLAECGACGRNKPVCCDEGYSRDPETGKVTHVGAVCVECCRPHHKGGSLWHGKSVAGGTYERCD